MNSCIVESSEPVTLIAGGPVLARDLGAALGRAPVLVAADSGADRALALGRVPVAVIGDGDSLSPQAETRLAAVLHRIPEQATTDFDKALRSIRAPFVLALGVTGGRVDHELAVYGSLVRLRPIAPRCIVLGRQDMVMALPPGRTTLRLRIGERLSLFPMDKVTGRSAGLRWPLAGIGFAPTGMVGTSNEVTARDVTLDMDGEGMLLILPRRALGAVLAVRPQG